MGLCPLAIYSFPHSLRFVISMIRFLVRRLLEMLPLLVLLSLLIFVLFQLIPGDYLSEMELNPSISRQTIEDLRRDYGLDKPFYIQYFLWLRELFRGNLGYSFAQQRPAVDLITERLGNTVVLTISSLTLTLLFSFPLGIYAALNPHRWPDRLVLLISLVGLSLPTVLASLLLLYFAFHTGWFPLGGTGGFRSVVLPSLALAMPSVAFFVRNLRLEMIETLRQPFVLAAAARGLPAHRVIFHALRNALNPTISMAGITFGGLLSGSVVVEKIFDWPVLGALTVDSILSRDLFVVLNCVLASALLIAFADLLADLILAWNDPRIRYS